MIIMIIIMPAAFPDLNAAVSRARDHQCPPLWKCGGIPKHDSMDGRGVGVNTVLFAVGVRMDVPQDHVAACRAADDHTMASPWQRSQSRHGPADTRLTLEYADAGSVAWVEYVHVTLLPPHQ